MRVEKPKVWAVLFPEVVKKYSADELIKHINKYKPIDEKGQYLHWDELRRRADQYEKPDLAWVSIKAARNQILKNIPLKDIAGDLFSFCIPDSLQCLLHQIDKMAG